ncbi:uncharacterized protein CTRU02_215083 [Colletotrichum truncatum]|uniref:Uncharacterized protein n=1 Tax=Colletotrichum truncatum TaxID=5467 RepID=A0ACC3YDE4_COLTU|nr:uncharacterized protein CTRU02_13730 [Colletotrichum truncatum]KAF6783078.1 hypothetical protein CTRU02_13730 [Colletotrichum truncatum]
MLLKKFFLGGLLLLGPVEASPYLQKRANECNRDNLFRCLIDTRYTVQAVAYCSGLSPFTTTVKTVTATSTRAITTIVGRTETNTITSTTTVFTTTVPVATETITRLAPTKRDVEERAAAPASPPKCVTSGTSYPASRITSACSCIGVPARTVSATATISTRTVTEKSTVTVTITAAATSWVTVSTATTAGTVTVTVEPPPAVTTNLLVNGDFETAGSPPRGWEIVSSSATVALATRQYGSRSTALMLNPAIGGVEPVAMVRQLFSVPIEGFYVVSFDYIIIPKTPSLPLGNKIEMNILTEHDEKILSPENIVLIWDSTNNPYWQTYRSGPVSLPRVGHVAIQFDLFNADEDINHGANILLDNVEIKSFAETT